MTFHYRPRTHLHGCWHLLVSRNELHQDCQNSPRLSPNSWNCLTVESQTHFWISSGSVWTGSLSLVCLCLYPLVYWHLLSSGSSLARPGWGPAAARPVRARIVLVASLRVTGPTLAVEMSSNLLWSYTTATVAGAVTIEKHVLCSDSWARQS